ncbi:MAG: hypothetical protein RIT26_2468 [Pseudomonadota bacterium]
MQALCCAWAGTRASNSALKLCVAHQHGGAGRPEVVAMSRAACMAQALACPHSGQRAGSTSGVICLQAPALTFSRQPCSKGSV